MKRINELFALRRFDIITCMGNTLAHLGPSGELTRFLGAVHDLTEEGGIFAGQVVNYENITADGSVSLGDIEGEDFIFSRKSSINTDKKIVEFTGELLTKNNNKKYVNRIDLYPITKNEIEKGLLESGFSTISFHGDYDLVYYRRDSNALIFKAVN